MDVFCVAAMEIAEELNIKLVINCPLTLESMMRLGLPNISNSFGFLGWTIVKPNLFTLFIHSRSPLMKKIGNCLTRHLVLIHSFTGLDSPVLLPPNVKMIGLPADESAHKEFPTELQAWYKSVREKDLKIIYVTFGSVLTATQEFVDHLYYGLKKTGLAVLWSVKDLTIPE